MVGRRGPGLVGTMATAAVIGGTAAATSHAIDRRMTRKDNERAAEQQAQYDAMQSQADMEDMKAQMAEMQAQQAQQAMMAQQPAYAPPPPAYAPPPPAAPAPAAGPDLMSQLQQLAQLKEAGALTDEEYAAAKAKLLS
jgi:hypothetical protein